jgi:hypothetical protein
VIYVVLAAFAAVVVEALACARIIASQARSHARREDLLVNQLCSLAGKPWEPPPAREPIREQLSTLVRSIDQYPDGEFEG